MARREPRWPCRRPLRVDRRYAPRCLTRRWPAAHALARRKARDYNERVRGRYFVCGWLVSLAAVQVPQLLRIGLQSTTQDAVIAQPHIEIIRQLPANFDDFVEEIAAGLASVYGAKAAHHYRENAARALGTSMAHPAITTWAVLDGSRTIALLMAVVRQNVAQLAFVHLLGAFEGRGIESDLVRRAVAHFRGQDVPGIVCEFVPLCTLDLEQTFDELGFDRIERLLLHAPLRERGLARPGLRTSAPVEPDDLLEVAEVICDAYANHPGRRLHVEVRSVEGAYAFIQSATQGAFGASRAGFVRCIRRDERIAGAIFGCEAAPDVGFVLQVAVRRDWQSKGLGTALLRDLALCFADAGYTRVALGVTSDNPARRLYERLGFRRLRPLTAYTWWR